MFYLHSDKIPNLPPPSACDACGGSRILFSEKENGPAYCCEDCGAAITCHAGTDIPMGKMADGDTRQLRLKAHIAFDPLWQSGLLSRHMAYKWLAAELKIRPADCHISWLTKDQLECCIKASLLFFEERKSACGRRSQKRQEAKERRKKVVKACIRRRKDK